MNRSDLFRGLGSSTRGMILAPQTLSRPVVKNSGGIPVPLELSGAGISCLIITAVGVGVLGSKMVRILAPSLTGINCLEACLDPNILDGTDMSDFCSRIRSSDLVFLLSGQEDAETMALFKSLGALALDIAALVVGIVPDKEWSIFTSLETMTEAPIVLDICSTVPKVCFSWKNGKGVLKKSRQLALTEYAMDYSATPISWITTEDSIGAIIRM